MLISAYSKIMRVCKDWRMQLQSPTCWQTIYISDHGETEHESLHEDVPISAVKRVMAIAAGQTQQTQLARMSRMDIFIWLRLRQLLEGKSVGLKRLHIRYGPVPPNDAYLSDDSDFEARNSLEADRRMENMVWDLLFPRASSQRHNTALGTSLEELLIDRVSSSIGQWRGTLPSSLRTLVLYGLAPYGEPHAPRFRLQMRTSLTKLIMRRTETEYNWIASFAFVSITLPDHICVW